MTVGKGKSKIAKQGTLMLLMVTTVFIILTMPAGICWLSIEFFALCTKLTEMAILYSKDLTTAKKVTSSGARPDATDYYWFRSPVPNQMS